MKIKIIALIAGLLSNSVHSEVLQVKVLAHNGEPVTQVAVYATSQQLPGQAKAKTVVIDQIDKEFVNRVTVVQTGTPVLFPNHDNIRHHVYSFSEAKSFELPLYEGMPDKPVVFDRPGLVTLGCNIHDWMTAYVYVVDSPYFAMTDQQGLAQINVPAGHDYVVGAWHPQLKMPDFKPAKITVAAGVKAELTLTLPLKKNLHAIRMPATPGLSVGYR